ncbi:MAG: hypothetical protein MJ224_01375 [archaeon]|nr:hypothetical protein [archaeon]
MVGGSSLLSLFRNFTELIVSEYSWCKRISALDYISSKGINNLLCLSKFLYYGTISTHKDAFNFIKNADINTLSIILKAFDVGNIKPDNLYCNNISTRLKENYIIIEPNYILDRDDIFYTIFDTIRLYLRVTKEQPSLSIQYFINNLDTLTSFRNYSWILWERGYSTIEKKCIIRQVFKAIFKNEPIIKRTKSMYSFATNTKGIF